MLISDTVPTPVDDLPELWMDLTGNVSDIPFIEGPTGPTGPTGPSGVWVSMTQAAYDALPVKDPDTLYVIVG